MLSSLLSRRNFLCASAALALAGCGRKSDPKPPPDADPKSPRTYPAPQGGQPGDSVPPPIDTAPAIPPSFR